MDPKQSFPEADDAMPRFLELIDKDIRENGSLRDLPEELADRMRSAAEEDVDLDEEISEVVEL